MEPRVIATAAQAAALFAPILAGSSEERVAVAHLDGERRLLGLSHHRGGADQVPLRIRAIISEALRFGSRGLVVAHNHPSGDPSPSLADREATRLLAATAQQVDVELYDHLIFAGGACRSFRALGLI